MPIISSGLFKFTAEDSHSSFLSIYYTDDNKPIASVNQGGICFCYQLNYSYSRREIPYDIGHKR